MNGIEATREINRLFSDTRVLILTTFNEEELIFEGLQNGAKGFLLKDMQSEELCKIIRGVYAGGVYLHTDVTQKILERISFMGTETAVDELTKNDIVQLTNREKDVLRLIGSGLSNIEISSKLFITEGTVKNHVSSLLSKLGARDRTQLALLTQKSHDLR